MKAAIFSLLPVRSGSTIASVRIGRWLSILLGIPLHDDSSISLEGQLDVLFIINGSTLYCKYLEEISEAVRRARKVIWVQNDYTLPPPKAESDAQSPFRRAFADRKLVPDFWTTCAENATRTPGSARVNWNALGAFSSAKPASLHTPAWLYYGAWREGRRDSFVRMANELQDHSFYVSSTSVKFRELAGPPKLIEPFRSDVAGCIASYGIGIYAQDKKSANADHSPATRFYEMLSVGLPMAFMPDCVPTLKKYGYDVSPYVLSNNMGPRRYDIAKEQQMLWWRDWETELKEQVRDLWESLDE